MRSAFFQERLQVVAVPPHHRSISDFQLNFFGHLFMMLSGCCPWKLFRTFSIGMRSWGFPRSFWRDNIPQLVWELLSATLEELEEAGGDKKSGDFSSNCCPFNLVLDKWQKNTDELLLSKPKPFMPYVVVMMKNNEMCCLKELQCNISS